MPAPLIKKWEDEINPILRQTDWPATFTPGHFCTGGEPASVAP